MTELAQTHCSQVYIQNPPPLPQQVLAWKAIKAGDYPALNDLCRKGVIINGRYPLLAEAVRLGCPLKLTELLIIKKANVNRSGRYRRTALHEAVIQGNALVLELLLKNGADPDVPDRIGRTALMTAAYMSNPLFVRRLLSAGANLNLRDAHGRTAWGLAKISPEAGLPGQKQICQLLSQAGARL